MVVEIEMGVVKIVETDAKHRNVFLAGTPICKYITHSKLYFIYSLRSPFVSAVVDFSVLKNRNKYCFP